MNIITSTIRVYVILSQPIYSICVALFSLMNMYILIKLVLTKTKLGFSISTTAFPILNDYCLA